MFLLVPRTVDARSFQGPAEKTARHAVRDHCKNLASPFEITVSFPLVLFVADTNKRMPKMDKSPDHKTGAVLPLTTLIDRAGLIRRWQHGSDSFFWRQEQAGRLLPVKQDGLLRYRWCDVLVFEGGLPPADWAGEYSADLMRPDQVAATCTCAPEFILNAARKGTLPARRIGQAWRFVPGEVARWHQESWAARTHRMKGITSKTGPSPPDE